MFPIDYYYSPEYVNIIFVWSAIESLEYVIKANTLVGILRLLKYIYLTHKIGSTTASTTYFLKLSVIIMDKSGGDFYMGSCNRSCR